MDLKKIHRTKRGFTILELLLVMAIMGILSTLVYGSYTNVVKNIDLDSTADAIIADLRATQAKAMSGNGGNAWGICFINPAGEDYYQVYSPPTSCDASGSAVSRGTVYLSNNIVLLSPAAGNATPVIFNKIDGTVSTASDVVISITFQDQSKTITITPAGRIYKS